MATAEQSAEAAGMSLTDFKALKPSQRMVFAARADAGTPYSDHAKRERVQAETELAALENRLSKLGSEQPAKFANGLELQRRTREFVADRIAGIRRRLDQP